MKAGFWEILLVVILILVLFGHSKIPEVMKNLASGINVFKKELKKDDASDKASATKAEPAATPIKKIAKPVAKKPVVKKKPASKKK